MCDSAQITCKVRGGGREQLNMASETIMMQCMMTRVAFISPTSHFSSLQIAAEGGKYGFRNRLNASLPSDYEAQLSTGGSGGDGGGGSNLTSGGGLFWWAPSWWAGLMGEVAKSAPVAAAGGGGGQTVPEPPPRPPPPTGFERFTVVIMTASQEAAQQVSTEYVLAGWGNCDGAVQQVSTGGGVGGKLIFCRKSACAAITLFCALVMCILPPPCVQNSGICPEPSPRHARCPPRSQVQATVASALKTLNIVDAINVLPIPVAPFK